MKRLTLYGLVTDRLILSTEKKELVGDLLHIYRTEMGSAQKLTDELLAELLAEAIIAIRENNVSTHVFKPKPDGVFGSWKKPAPEIYPPIGSLAIDEAIMKLIKEKNIADDKLTRDQIASALKQALACGDFQKNVRVTDGASAVVYLPYSEAERLAAELRELKDQARDAKRDHPGDME